MKKVSCKVFFTVVWRGICQAVRWFFGLFGYKREGKFAHCVWGLFALSCTVIVTIAAGALVIALGSEFYGRHRGTFCDGEGCMWNTYLSNDFANEDRSYQNYIIRERAITEEDLQKVYEAPSSCNLEKTIEDMPLDILPLVYYGGYGRYIKFATRKKI